MAANTTYYIIGGRTVVITYPKGTTLEVSSSRDGWEIEVTNKPCKHSFPGTDCCVNCGELIENTIAKTPSKGTRRSHSAKKCL